MSADQQEQLDLEDIREILVVFGASDLTDLDLRVGTTHLRLSRGGGDGEAAGVSAPTFPAETAPVPHVEDGPDTPASSEVTAEPAADVPRAGLEVIVAPMVGVFYRRPNPERPPYVEVGATVAVDTPVCTIEVMKMFNEVKAGVTGRIVEIAVADEALVQAGDPLFYVEPT